MPPKKGRSRPCFGPCPFSSRSLLTSTPESHEGRTWKIQLLLAETLRGFMGAIETLR